MNTVSRRLIAFLLALLAVALLLYFGQGEKQRVFRQTRSSLYTMVSITVVTDSEAKAMEVTDAAYRELDRLGRLLNFYAEDSELTAINNNAGKQPVRVSPETLEIVKAAVYAGEQTEGGFDVTVGPIVKLWNFQDMVVPSADDIAAVMPVVGYENIIIDENASAVFLKKEGVSMDLGGIIKGFAADKAVKVLKAGGISAGIVAVAGDIHAFGHQPDGRPWRIGIQNPRQKEADDLMLATVELADQAISTSGDYQKFFFRDDVRYHHLLNPKTGYPESLCQSVTVISPTATFTDPFATGIFIMGPEKGIALLERLGMNGVIVNKDGKVLMTRNLQGKVHMAKP